jgi:CubicO group peptidase (beta-lactamase class C family)
MRGTGACGAPGSSFHQVLKMTFWRILWLAAITAALCPAQPGDDEIRQLLVDRIDAQHKSAGMIVGIIGPQGRRLISYGKVSETKPQAPQGDTVFEIGSMTKVFTCLLLADMVQRGEVALTDPVAKYLPPGTKVPERNGRQITLVDLATHTSGLPFLPTGFPGFKNSRIEDPVAFASYTDEQLYQFLATFELPREIGATWAYSNLGAGLLGKALARRAGMSYEALVRTRITGPLGMDSTSIAVSPEMKNRLAAGHDKELKPAAEWNLPVFEAAGSMRSTANDLLTFLAAFLGRKESALAPAMKAMLETRRPGPGIEQALGWWILKIPPAKDDGFVLFGGQTLGYACTVAYDPKMATGVVVLSNAAQDDGGIGVHLLRPAFPVVTSALAKALAARKEIALDPKLLDLYAGRYQPPAPDPAFSIERRGDNLFLVSESAPQGLRLHAESERRFFLTETELQATFETDAGGRATAVVIRFLGIDTRAARIEPEPRKDGTK